MRGGAILAGAGILLFAILAGVAFVFGRGLTVTTGESYAEAVEELPPQPPADGSYGLVRHSYQSRSGLEVFGWTIIPPKYRAHVIFVPPAGCVVPESGELKAQGACAGIPAEGTVTGGGVSFDGHETVIVAVEISKACHEVLQRYDRWPSEHPACRE